MQLRHTPQAARSSRRAFTLLEVLVVVAIIVMLAGVGSFYVYQRYEDAKLSGAKIGAKKLAASVEAYKLREGNPPASLQDLTQPPTGTPFATPEELLDPWGKRYQLDPNPDVAIVFTTTPKGKRIDSASSR
jgi:general secretion pathway protein G